MPTSNGALSGFKVGVIGETLAGALAGRLLHEQGAEVTLFPSSSAGEGNNANDGAAGFIPPPAWLVDGFTRATVNSITEGLDAVVLDTRVATLPADVGSNIIVRLRGFAGDDPRNETLPATEGVLGALTGYFTDVHFMRARINAAPVASALPLASVYSGVWAAISVAAALLRKLRGGFNSQIEVPMADAAMSALGGIIFRVHDEADRYKLISKDPNPPPAPDAMVSKLVDNFHLLLPALFTSYACKDGRRIFFNALDHRQHSKLLFSSMGLLDDITALGIENRDPYEATGTPNLTNGFSWGPELLQKVRGLLAARFAQRTAFEWEEILCNAGVPAAVVRTTKEFLEIPALQQAGVVEVGLNGVAHPGPFVTVRAAAVSATNNLLPDLQPLDAPLKGVNVLDLASLIAGPASARVLAELGATVYRVESAWPGVGPRMTLWWGVDLNRGKKSYVADLTNLKERERAFGLAEMDVVVHNKVDSTASKLGLTDAELAARTSDTDKKRPLVAAQITAYGGPKPGPWSNRPSFDPVLQASGGIMTRYGTLETPQLHAIASCIDYLTGYLNAFGIICGLVARQRGFGAQKVETSLARATLCIQLPFVSSDWTDTEPSGQNAKSTGFGDILEKVEGGKGEPAGSWGWVLRDSASGFEVPVLDHRKIRAERCYDADAKQSPPSGSIKIRTQTHPRLGKISTVDPNWLRPDWEVPELGMAPWPGDDDEEGASKGGWPGVLPS